jgi:hypothetical protein
VCVWFQFAKGNLIWRKVKSSNLVLVWGFRFLKGFQFVYVLFRFEEKKKFLSLWFWISRKIIWFENTSIIKMTLLQVGTIVSFGWVHPLF